MFSRFPQIVFSSHWQFCYCYYGRL